MKVPFSFVLSFVLVSSHGQIKCSTKDFKITEATVQSWSPGAKQPNDKPSGGLIYQINATILRTRQLKFDSLYLDGKLVIVEVVKGADRNYAGGFTKGDKVVILARPNNGDVFKSASATLSTAISKSKKKGKGFVSYWIDNKRYITPIGEFKKSSSQNRNQ